MDLADVDLGIVFALVKGTITTKSADVIRKM
jgi:hypothetical protein